jgi:hypothetical protein
MCERTKRTEISKCSGVAVPGLHRHKAWRGCSTGQLSVAGALAFALALALSHFPLYLPLTLPQSLLFLSLYPSLSLSLHLQPVSLQPFL